jgi:predicted RND superfamily exporter protein
LARDEESSGKGGESKKRTPTSRGRGEPSDSMDETLDRVVSELGDRTPEYTDKARTFIKGARKKLTDLDTRAEESSHRMFAARPAEVAMEAILKHRIITFTLCIVVGLVMAYVGVIGPGYLTDSDPDKQTNMESKIRADFEVYLPRGSDAERVLEEVKLDFSVDMGSIFVETQNKFDRTDETNITDYSILSEMSRIEELLNTNKTDRGDSDGICYIFSISTLVKTLHNATNETMNAVFMELNLKGWVFTPPEEVSRSNYTIPEDQRLINEFFYRVPPHTLRWLIADSNGDGIYDSALILIGLSKKVDQRELIDRINDLVGPYYADPGTRPGSEDTTNEWMQRYESGEVHTRMTLTGPTPMARMIGDRTFAEMATILPWGIVMVAGALLLFHRTPKIWLITMFPVFVALLMTFGFIGIVMNELTPQVVLVAPILIALGTAYGIYIANRYAEESHILDREQRIRYAIKTTGKAIFLSAAATAFGFGSMITVDMATMQVLGIGLSSGIIFCYICTMIMSPTLVIWLDYKKKPGSVSGSSSPLSKKIGQIPMNHSRKIIIGATIFALISLAMAPMFEIPMTDIKVGGFSIVQANMDYIKLSPMDEPIVQKLDEQSEVFQCGQIGLFIVRGEPPMDDDHDGNHEKVKGSIKDYEILTQIKRVGDKINGIEGAGGIPNADSISIVDVMMLVQVPDFTNSTMYRFFIDNIPPPFEEYGATLDAWIKDNLIGKSFWDAAGLTYSYSSPGATLVLKEDLYCFLINVFYNSLGVELRSMLINEDYSKTVIYVIMPNMDIIETEDIVNQVDDAIADSFIVQVGEKGGQSASPLTGFGKILVTINNLLVADTLQSTLIAMFMAFLLLSVAFRSWRLGLITTAPVMFVVCGQYFAMWGIAFGGDIINPRNNMFSGDLNLFTALIGSIIIGIGVDYSIHITQRIKQKGFQIESVAWAAETSGWSFIEATTTMVVGMSAVFLVNIPSIREFILLIIILLIFSAFVAIFLCTSFYRLYLPRYNKLLAMKKH